MSTRATDYLKECAVQVHRVRLVASAVVKFPNFGAIEGYRFINSLTAVYFSVDGVHSFHRH